MKQEELSNKLSLNIFEYKNLIQRDFEKKKMRMMPTRQGRLNTVEQMCAANKQDLVRQLCER